jgi:hypothetical protein
VNGLNFFKVKPVVGIFALLGVVVGPSDDVFYHLFFGFFEHLKLTSKGFVENSQERLLGRQLIEVDERLR